MPNHFCDCSVIEMTMGIDTEVAFYAQNNCVHEWEMLTWVSECSIKHNHFQACNQARKEKKGERFVVFFVCLFLFIFNFWFIGVIELHNGLNTTLHVAFPKDCWNKNLHSNKNWSALE